MIQNKDRSGWIGASDTAMVMGRWDTPSFARWWAVKLGLLHSNFSNVQTRTGSAFEHRILDFIGVRRRDRQIKIRPLRLRVNLDGESRIIHEVKTYGAQTFKVTRPYWMQCQVEIFAARKGCEIVAYHLEPEDYVNWFRPIDAGRISHHPIPYDAAWVNEQYISRLRTLAKCLKKGVFPHESAD